jgi:RHS repeat-associated protein
LGDGNGNVEASVVYSPFGTVIDKASKNPDKAIFAFSTKTADASGLNYYGYRFYDGEMGRWLTQDPMHVNKKSLLVHVEDGLDVLFKINLISADVQSSIVSSVDSNIQVLSKLKSLRNFILKVCICFAIIIQ